MKNYNNFRQPLSKTAVETLEKWSPSPRVTSNWVLIGLNNEIRRNSKIVACVDQLIISPFKEVGITITYHYGLKTLLYYEVCRKGWFLIFTDLQSIFDYYEEFYRDTISYNLFINTSNKFKWSTNRRIKISDEIFNP